MAIPHTYDFTSFLNWVILTFACDHVSLRVFLAIPHTYDFNFFLHNPNVRLKSTLAASILPRAHD